MNICMIGSFPPPYGGVATHCYYLAKYLSKQENNIYFFDTNPASTKNIPQGVTHFQVFRLSWFKLICLLIFSKKYLYFFRKISKIVGFNRVENIRLALSLIQELEKANVKVNFDIIHSQHASMRSLAGKIYADLRMLPFILTIHGAEVTIDEIYRRDKKIINYLIKNSITIITVSEFTSAHIRKKGFRGRIDIIFNGVELDDFRVSSNLVSTVAQKYKVPSNKKVILYISSFRHWKGPDIFIRSLQHLNFPYVAYMIGNDLGYLDHCKNMVKQFNLSDRVHFMTDLPIGEIVAFYHIADVFIFPTKYESEGFGIVALEAMASGTPVIASNIAAIPEVVIDETTGLLFNPGNFQELSAKINLLFHNDELYNRLQKNALNYVKVKYSWRSIAEEVHMTYKNLSLHAY